MEEFLWTEKYRPLKISDCVLPSSLSKTFKGIVSSGELPNMLLASTAGTGKTTVARALCNELGVDHIMINCSEENGIDVLRGKIKSFASTISLEGGYKVVILDEADYITPSAQGAFRGFIEEFSSNCRFIFTCNFKHRIIEPLHSRCAVIEFNTPKKDLPGLAMRFMKRLEFILQNEGIKYDKRTISELIIKHAPDWRRVIGECQRYAAAGEITTEVLVGSGGIDESLDLLIEALKGKNFRKMRQWIADNASMDTTVIFRAIYDRMGEFIEPQTIPAAVLVLAEYSYKSAFMADKELNLVACMVELGQSVQWKS